MIGFITAIGVLAVLYWIVAAVINKMAEEKRLPNSIAILVVGLMVAIGMSFVTVVPAQECGVVVTPGGVLKESYPTGWHVIMPWYRVEKMDKTVQVYTCANLGSDTLEPEPRLAQV